jgi:hypothetical protein
MQIRSPILDPVGFIRRQISVFFGCSSAVTASDVPLSALVPLSVVVPLSALVPLLSATAFIAVLASAGSDTAATLSGCP